MLLVFKEGPIMLFSMPDALYWNIKHKGDRLVVTGFIKGSQP
jgi:hypothetical protein